MSIRPPTSSHPERPTSGADFVMSRMATGRNSRIAWEKSSLTNLGFSSLSNAEWGGKNRPIAA